MMLKLREIVHRMFAFFRLYPPMSFPSPEEVFDHLRFKSDEIKAFVLQKVVRVNFKSKNHAYYNELLKTFVPEWQIAIENPQFVSMGLARNSLNPHRKVFIDGKPYFEKVYFNFYDDLEAVCWMQENVFELIKNRIKTPLVKRQYRGELLSVAYYDFWELDPIPPAEEEQVLTGFSAYLYRVSNDYFTASDIAGFPFFITDFYRHIVYDKYRNAVEDNWRSVGMDLNEIERRVAGSKRVLTHGDIVSHNAFGQSTFIDWDHFGFYPIGFDPAYTYYFLLRDNKLDEAFESWLERNYKTTISREDWPTFKRNALYFLYVFAFKIFFVQKRHRELEQRLLQKIKGGLN